MFKPNEKQDASVRKMEAIIGIEEHQHETVFENKEKFQKYFSELMAAVENKIKKDTKHKNFMNAVKLGKIDLKEITQKRKEKIKKYYEDNPSKLLEKALEYQSKYQVSIGKVIKWLNKKIENSVIISEISEKLNKNISEDYILYVLILNGLKNGKSLKNLRFELEKRKFFKKENIENVISSKFNNEEIQENDIKNLISKYQRKKMNKNEIKYHLKVLLEHLPDQILEIDNYLEKYYSDDIRETQLDKDFEKLTKGIFEKQKVINSLMRKGYQYKDIKQKFEKD